MISLLISVILALDTVRGGQMRSGFRILPLLVLMGMASASPAQIFSGGYDLVVRQHPTDADPVVIVEVWSWTEIECGDDQSIVGYGVFDMEISSPIVASGSGQVFVDCKLPDLGFQGACDTPFSPRAGDLYIVEFAFVNTYGGSIGHRPPLVDNPLHLMDIRMNVDDLTRRNVTLSTVFSEHISGCLAGSFASMAITPIIIEGETIIRVNGACRADFDGDGSLSIFDFLAYQNAFATGDLKADLDGDGVLTLFDFLAFQNEFDAGCE